jgi:hypothetical protein
MAHKTTGTKNQDKVSDPEVNENPDEKGYAKKQEEISSGAVSDPQPVKNRHQENLQNRGLEEDQPKNPVRSTGSLAKDQQENKYRQPGDKFPEDTDKISS